MASLLHGLRLAPAFLAGVLAVSVSAAEEAPLTDIWGMQASGVQSLNRYVESLEDVSRHASLRKTIDQIITAIVRVPMDYQAVNPGTAYVLNGEPLDVLSQCPELITKERPDNPELVAGEPLTLFFYSPASAYTLHIESVAVEGETVTVRYRYAQTNFTMIMTSFAIADLEDLPAGQYQIVMTPVAGDDKTADNQEIKQPTFTPSKFTVPGPSP